MSVIYILLPLSVLVAAGFLAAFIWAVRSGQYEDTYTPSLRLLTEDRTPANPPKEDGDSAADQTKDQR